MRARGALRILFCVALLAVPPLAVDAQDASRWFPELRPFPALIAAPREVQFRTSLILAERPMEGTYEGRNFEAEVAVGHQFPVLRLMGGVSSDRAVTLDLEMGIFSRFFLETEQNDQVNTDYRVGMPVSFRNEAWQVRITLRHISSHLGDDYIGRFLADVVDTDVGQTTRDGIEAIVARALSSGGRLYVGADYNFHVNKRISRAALRLGGEWDPVAPGRAGALWPFLAGDFEYTTLADRWGTTLVAGMGVRVGDRIFRLEARARVGTTPMGHFREREETFFGLGLSLQL